MKKLSQIIYNQAMCLMHVPYDRIVAITKNTRIRDQEEKNKTFTIY